MPTEKISLTLPREWDILLKTQLGTDGKVDRLLPLLELLNDPEHPMSELGQVLIDALQQISEDLREASILRSAHREALEQASKTNATLMQTLHEMSQSLQDVRQDNGNLARQIDDIHKLMFSPAD